jgi:SAM-dependent methyltransferase
LRAGDFARLLTIWAKIPYGIGEKRWRQYFQFEYAKAAVLIRQIKEADLGGLLRGRLLDIASGFAGCTQAFRDLLPVEYAVSLDISSVKQRFARGMVSGGVGVTVADALRLPFPTRTFDLALSFSSIEHMSAPREFLMGLYDCLTPGGTAIVAFPTFYSIKGGHISFPFIHWLPTPACRVVATLLGRARQFETYLGLNRLTIAEFQLLCADVGFDVLCEGDLLWGKLLIHTHLAREVLATTYFAVLGKPL